MSWTCASSFMAMKTKKERSDFKFKRSNPILNTIKFFEYQNLKSHRFKAGNSDFLHKQVEVDWVIYEKFETLLLSPVFLIS